MSELFDDLARALARPMPRSRAVRAFGVALVSVGVPGALRTPRAAAGTLAVKATNVSSGARASRVAKAFCEKSCSGVTPVPCLCKNDRNKGPYAGCFETCGVSGSTCCCLKGSDGFNSGAVACPPGTRCGRPGEVNCPCINTCGDPSACCGRDEFCANPRERLCCKQGERGCGRFCCKPNQECRSIRVGTASTVTCEDRCPPNRAWCGRSTCCPPRWRCANERTGLCKRCGRNEEECGTKCCDRRTSRCCGKAGCCPNNRSCCVNGPEQVCCAAGTKCAIPILSGNIGLVPKTKAICCPTERLNNEPKLCCPPGQVALNNPGFRIPPRSSISPFCCPRSMTCSSPSGRVCVDLQSDPANCGSCGNACPSGTCTRGVCALP